MSVPVGGIVMWSGAIGAIPAGFHLCDGGGGTPDLRNSFIVAAGVAYAIGDTGGVLENTPLSHVHAAGWGVVNESTHKHPVTGSTAAGGGFVAVQASVPTTTVPTRDHTHTLGPQTDAGQAHNHTLSGNVVTADDTVDNRPYYYALAFIMRVS